MPFSIHIHGDVYRFFDFLSLLIALFFNSAIGIAIEKRRFAHIVIG